MDGFDGALRSAVLFLPTAGCSPKAQIAHSPDQSVSCRMELVRIPMKVSFRHARSESLAAQALPLKDAAWPLPRRNPSIPELRLPRHRDETTALAPPVEIRSEERRVGKEGRSPRS